MEVYTRSASPYWQADIYVGGQRRRVSLKPLTHSGKGSVKQGAAALAAEKMQTLLETRNAMVAQARTLREALDDYVTILTETRKASAANVAALRDKCLGLSASFRGRYHLDPDMPLTDLKPMDLEHLVRERRREGNAPQTIAHEIKMIRAAVREAAGLGYAVPLPMVNGSVKNPWRMPALTPKTRYLSWPEFEAVYAYLSPDREVTAKTRKGADAKPYALTGRKQDDRQAAQDLLVALVMTGGRWSEATALTWDRVDLAAGSIRLFGTKDNEERTVPIPAQLREVLERRRAASGGNSHLIFPGRHGEQRGGTCRAILRAMTAVGLNRPDSVARYGRATVHSLRHTFASWLLQNGADLAEVQDALGHASMQMTRRYAHLAKARTVSKLGGILSGMGGAT